MIPSDNNKRLFLDMQEHPENYSDEQLEAMMDELDRHADTGAAWQRFEHTTSLTSKPSRRWLRIAAMFAGVMIMAGIAFAAIRSFTSSPVGEGKETTSLQQKQTTPVVPVKGGGDESVFFENVSLDSILSVVASHYMKTVKFHDDSLRCLKLIMTWEPDASLTDFIDRLNAFDGLSLSVQNDTIIVMQSNDEEDDQ